MPSEIYWHPAGAINCFAYNVSSVIMLIAIIIFPLSDVLCNNSHS